VKPEGEKMNSHYLFLLALILLVIIPWITRQRRLAAVKQILNRKKQNKENNVMKELAKQFIGEECIIYTITSNDGSVLGVIKEIGDGGMIIERKSGEREIINLDFVTRIREYPRKKNGKKKNVVLD
jgi:heme exporter protein D